MKKNSDKIYAAALYEALEDAKDAQKIILGFLNFLKEKSQLHRIDTIIREFENIYNKKNNIAKLKIKSANPLSQEIIEKIARALDLENYELESEVDKKIIGGFIAKYNDNLIDLSVKNQLKRLHSLINK